MTRDDQIREQLLNVIRVIQPYARAQGRFHNVDDLRAAIRLALQYLERAELLVDRRMPGGRGRPTR
jgi:predicted ArsR family transcriptional regulator